MSSLRNAVKRKTHKERAQPLARRRLGLLEKKADYRKRADDFHRKEKAIKTLQRKADERNPDEFYFAMQNAQTKDGVHVGRSAEANKYSQEELLLMKTQDAGYISLKAQAEGKKLARLREVLHFTQQDRPPGRQHFTFEDDDDAADAKATDDTPMPSSAHGELLEHRSALQGSQDAADSLVAQKAAARLQRRQQLAYEELSQRLDRYRKLNALASDMRLQKQLMGKGRRRKLKEHEVTAKSEAPVFKWHKSRQR